MSNTMPQFKNCKLTLALEAQSPMIHFQADTAGATLRASEAKPKLDRFLLDKLCAQQGCSVAALKKDATYKSIFVIADHDALNYKMQIVSQAAAKPIPLGLRTDYDIFYGNMGDAPTKYGVLTNPTVSILCMNAALRSLIEEYIVAFFLTTNFGTMQGKGFGSFAPVCCGYGNELTPAQQKEIAAYLKVAYRDPDKLTLPPCYAMKFSPVQGNKEQYCGQMFKKIKDFYQVMKSGRNPVRRPQFDYVRSYIYTYMHKKDIGNEKAWMKRMSIANCAYQEQNRAIVEKAGKVVSKNGDRYVRAMLGIGDTITFRRDNEHNIPPKTVSIKSLGTGDMMLERLSSPIYFKIVKNVVFIIAKPLPSQIYEHDFSFDNKRNGRGTLRTPTKAEFDIQDFLKSYVAFYSDELCGNKQMLGNAPVVTEVEA